MDEDGPREAVARFAFVELLAGLTPQFSIFQPIEGEQRAFKPPQLAQRRGEAVLPPVGGELAQDQRGGQVPVRIEAATRSISDQWARIRATLMRPAISG